MLEVLAGVFLGLVLSACGDAYERVHEGPWKPAGTATVPKAPDTAHQPKFSFTVLEVGDGPEIGPGSLVHVSAAGQLIPSEQAAGRYVSPIEDVWFWIGVADLYYIQGRSIVTLGSAELRSAFVGARQGSRLSLVLDPKGFDSQLTLPTKGFLLDHTKRDLDGAGFDREKVTFSKIVQYEFKVLRVCQGALVQKQAILKQWGYVSNWAPSYPFAREGVLEWAAIEGRCASPTETIRFEKGPAYRKTSGSVDNTGTLTLMWPWSYENAVKNERVSRHD